jgi:hypothetical protein
MLSTACVDKDYDLGNIDTDNIAIGDEGSQFRIPLVKVLVSKDEIKNNGGNIEEIFREADIWFPPSCPTANSSTSSNCRTKTIRRM